jgi:hypothetical protein
MRSLISSMAACLSPSVETTADEKKSRALLRRSEYRFSDKDSLRLWGCCGWEGKGVGGLRKRFMPLDDS